MKRNRNDNAKKERIIMIASSAFVLAALTMTGVYMQSKDQESQNDGYTIDFTALENSVDDKGMEIAQNLEGTSDLAGNITNLEDDLDYMPMEANSNDIEIPGLTDKDTNKDAANPKQPDADATEKPTNPVASAESSTPAADAEVPETEELQNQESEAAETSVVAQELHYAESEGLTRPLNGETLIPFSTEKSVYFTTLDQYKRNTALIISAEEGTVVTACAEGKVVDIFQNEEIGHAVTMELGDGYQITYGQLEGIQVAVGSYVDAGDIIGTVASPTKYYVREGSNLYLKVTANGTPVNPETLFQ